MGSGSLAKSLKTGIGIIMIIMFMIGYYRVPGTVATVSPILRMHVLRTMVLLKAT